MSDALNSSHLESQKINRGVWGREITRVSSSAATSNGGVFIYCRYRRLLQFVVLAFFFLSVGCLGTQRMRVFVLFMSDLDGLIPITSAFISRGSALQTLQTSVLHGTDETLYTGQSWKRH